jgi:hypothetical protein
VVCPFASLIGVGAVASGSQKLLVRDHRYRVYAWIALAVLGGGWLGYFLYLRRDEVRIALEVASVLALVAGGLRLRSLVRSGGVEPLTAGTLGRVMLAFGHAVASPWVAGAKAWLLAMVTFEWLGRASFSGWEYVAAVTVLLSLVAIRLLRRSAATRFGATAPAAVCPLGFGCAPVPAGDAHAQSGVEVAASRPWRRDHAASLATGTDS